MSTTATLVVFYFAIGLGLMTVRFAKETKGRRSEASLPVVDDHGITAGVLIFIVLLWPVWLVSELIKSDEKK